MLSHTLLHTILGLAGLLFVHPAHADSLNKCIDAQGRVTYSNLPCNNAREARKIEVDPAPPTPLARPPLAPKPVSGKSAPAQDAGGRVKMDTLVTPKHKTNLKAHEKTCQKLADKLGKVLDAMDEARHQGYSQSKMDKWNQQVKELEHKKQEAGCF